jgi:hypothetical protein
VYERGHLLGEPAELILEVVDRPQEDLVDTGLPVFSQQRRAVLDWSNENPRRENTPPAGSATDDSRSAARRGGAGRR